MTKQNEKTIVEGKVFAILSYLSILCIIPLVIKKDNEFVLSHSKQGLVLFIGQVMVFVASILFQWLIKPAFFVIGILSVWGIIEVLQGRYVKLPVVYKIAEKITL